MSRKIERTINSFRKSRIDGEKLLEEGRISWEDFCEIMRGYETDLTALGVCV